MLATITRDPTVMGNKFEGLLPAICLYLQAVMRQCVRALQSELPLVDRLDRTIKEADI